jgi:hypothetical protein
MSIPSFLNFGPLFQSQKPSLSFDLETMLKKARAFTDSDAVYNYIETVLNNPEFQANPKQYLENWRKQRGKSEQILFPEDDARGFITDNFKF